MASKKENNRQGKDSKSKFNISVSVIIPVYNDEILLRKCLLSLQEQTFPPELIEIIVVDNGSDKSPKPVVAEFNNVQLLHEPTPGSYTARNLAIAQAKGEVWAFIDSDIVASPDWLKHGVEMLYSQAEVGAVGGKVDFSYQDELNPSAVELYDSLTSFKQKEYIENDHFSGAGNLFSFPKIFQDVGLFNRELKSGGDREWGNRVHDAGYPLLYAEKAVVYHPARTSLKEMLKKHRRVAGGNAQKLINDGKISWGKFIRSQMVEVLIFLRLCKEILFDGKVPLRKMAQVWGINVLITLLRILEPYRVLMGGNPSR